MGPNYLNVAAFRQMCGRAGRLGYDSGGEAIICLPKGDKSPKEMNLCQSLITSKLEPLRSNLHLAYGGGLEKLLLEMIACGRITHDREVLPFVQCSLMFVQIPRDEVIFYNNKSAL